MRRKQIAAANWKMNTKVNEGIDLVEDLFSKDLSNDTEVVVCAPFTHLYTISDHFKGSNHHLGAQNMSDQSSGAYTGEISSDMLLSCGVSHVIIGHSERRNLFGEGNQLLAAKLNRALEAGLVPIFCCGEQLAIRKSGSHVDFVIDQLRESFAGFETSRLSELVIAYEPIWAIGTGETASPQQAQDMHAEIRTFLNHRFGGALADKIPILYGGSVKPGNAEEIFSQRDVDGGLVGGASLKAESFAAIVNSF